MARTAPRAPSLQNYWENARMRAVLAPAGPEKAVRPY